MAAETDGISESTDDFYPWIENVKHMKGQMCFSQNSIIFVFQLENKILIERNKHCIFHLPDV